MAILMITSTSSSIITTLPGVFAADPLSASVRLLEESGQPVEWVAPSKSKNVLVEITVNGPNFQVLHIDVENLNSRRHSRNRLTFRSENCVATSDTQHVCTSGAITMFRENFNIVFPVVMVGTTSESTSLQINIPESHWDNTPPTLVSIRPPNEQCTPDNCYVGNFVPTPVVVTAQDDKSGIEQGLLALSVATDQTTLFFPELCTSSTCSFTIRSACQDGRDIGVSLSPHSRDDAGNTFPSRTASPFTCDQHAPEWVEDPSFTTTVGHQSLVASTARPISFSARAYDSTSPTVTMLMDVSELTGDNETLEVDCVPEDASASSGSSSTVNGLICQVDVRDLLPGHHRVSFQLRDMVGFVSDTRFLEISVLDEGPSDSGESGPQAFRLRETPKMYPPPHVGISRVALALANTNNLKFPIYGFFTLSHTNNFYDPKFVDVSIDPSTCSFMVEDREFDATFIRDIQVSFDEEHQSSPIRANIFVGDRGVAVNRLPNNAYIDCDLSITVRDRERLYTDPQIMPISFNLVFRGSALGDPGSAFERRIAQQITDTSDFETAMEEATLRMGQLNSVCRVQQSYNQLKQGAFAIQTTGALLRGSSIPGVAEAGRASVLTGGLTRQAATEGTDKLFYSVGAVVQKSCDFLNCRIFSGIPMLDKFNELDENFASWVQNDAGVPSMLQDYGITNDLGVSDVRKSLFMSIMKGCIPGIVYNMNKYHSVGCERLVCMRENAVHGLDVSTCDRGADLKTCQFVAGEFMELPFVRVFKQFSANMENIASNIPTLFGDQIYRLVTKCPKEVPTTETSLKRMMVCHLPRIIREQIDLADRMRRPSWSFPVAEQNVCQAAKCLGPDCAPRNYDLFNTELAAVGSIRVRPREVDGGVIIADLVSDIEGVYSNLADEERHSEAFANRESMIKRREGYNDFIKAYENRLHSSLPPGVTRPALDPISEDDDMDQIRAKYQEHLDISQGELSFYLRYRDIHGRAARSQAELDEWRTGLSEEDRRAMGITGQTSDEISNEVIERCMGNADDPRCRDVRISPDYMVATLQQLELQRDFGEKRDRFIVASDEERYLAITGDPNIRSLEGMSPGDRQAELKRRFDLIGQSKRLSRTVYRPARNGATVERDISGEMPPQFEEGGRHFVQTGTRTVTGDDGIEREVAVYKEANPHQVRYNNPEYERHMGELDSISNNLFSRNARDSIPVTREDGTVERFSRYDVLTAPGCTTGQESLCRNTDGDIVSNGDVVARSYVVDNINSPPTPEQFSSPGAEFTDPAENPLYKEALRKWEAEQQLLSSATGNCNEAATCTAVNQAIDQQLGGGPAAREFLTYLETRKDLDFNDPDQVNQGLKDWYKNQLKFQTTDFFMRYALNTLFVKFNLYQYMTSAYIIDLLGGSGEAFNEVIRWASPEQWTNSICNNAVNPYQDAAGGVQTVFDSTGKVVLTFGAERIDNYVDEEDPSVNKLYSLAAFIGPVPREFNGLPGPDELQFRVFLTGSAGDVDLFEDGWRVMAPRTPVEISESFASSDLHSRICVQFSTPFPVGNRYQKREEIWCRPINMVAFNREDPPEYRETAQFQAATAGPDANPNGINPALRGS